MKTLLRIPTEFMIAAFVLVFVAAACQGHSNPRAHIDDVPAEPGLVKKKYYHKFTRDRFGRILVRLKIIRSCMLPRRTI